MGSQSPCSRRRQRHLVAFNGRTVAGSDTIRVLALEPAIIGTDIESSLARFDARWISPAPPGRRPTSRSPPACRASRTATRRTFNSG